MSKILALKFLILQTLSKNKSKIKSDLHAEIAKSLNVTKTDESLNITWIANKKNKDISFHNFRPRNDRNFQGKAMKTNDNPMKYVLYFIDKYEFWY